MAIIPTEIWFSYTYTATTNYTAIVRRQTTLTSIGITILFEKGMAQAKVLAMY